MRRSICIQAALLCLALSGAGCATMSKGSSQSIQVGSKPEGAECTFTRAGESVGKVTTPGSITVTRSKVPIDVLCTKDGYDESRSVMNSQTIVGPSGPGLVGGVLAIGTVVDMASGADTAYHTALTMKLDPISAADQAAASRAATEVAAKKPVQVAAKPTVAGPAGPYDGSYAGEVDVLQTNLQPYVPHLRVFAVRIVNGVGTGTVKHALCDEPGEVFFLVEPSGAVRGKANTRNTTGCTDRFAMLQGHVEGGVMHLTLRLINNPEFALTRSGAPAAASPVAAAVPAPVTGPFDGSYRGGLEVAQGDMRRLWVRVKGTKATGTSRVALCPTPGAISMNIDSSGAISGEADLQTSASCNPRKATLSGHAEGKRLVVTASFADGSQAREVSFNREGTGVGVDD